MSDFVIIPDCKYFNGYKPCFPGKKCNENCVDFKPVGTKILFISLEAMGTVLMSTALLHSIKRKYPVSSIHWITYKNSVRLLDNNDLIDKVWIWDHESIFILQEMKFDLAFNIDKTQKACAFINSVYALEKLGFGLNKNGAVVPLNPESEYGYILGLDDELKFRKNQRTGLDIMAECLCLPYEKDEYFLNLSDNEKKYCSEYKKLSGIKDNEIVIGFNTGCSEIFPNKKMTIDQHIFLINEISKFDNVKILLLGGPEDTERNKIIEELCKGKVINTPTSEGVRKGICYENLCDLVITGDSFGMHLAIALKKYVIVWFGLSCWTEIELYERGIKLIPEGLECAPCWKKECPKNLECIKMIDLQNIIDETKKYIKSRLKK